MRIDGRGKACWDFDGEPCAVGGRDDDVEGEDAAERDTSLLRFDLMPCPDGRRAIAGGLRDEDESSRGPDSLGERSALIFMFSYCPQGSAQRRSQARFVLEVISHVQSAQLAPEFRPVADNP